jgi:hypothetical protein
MLPRTFIGNTYECDSTISSLNISNVSSMVSVSNLNEMLPISLFNAIRPDSTKILLYHPHSTDISYYSDYCTSLYTNLFTYPIQSKFTKGGEHSSYILRYTNTVTIDILNIGNISSNLQAMFHYHYFKNFLKSGSVIILNSIFNPKFANYTLWLYLRGNKIWHHGADGSGVGIMFI